MEGHDIINDLYKVIKSLSYAMASIAVGQRMNSSPSETPDPKPPLSTKEAAPRPHARMSAFLSEDFHADL